jgi:hypothetical protein
MTIQRGTRVRSMGVGGQPITGTVLGPGATHSTNPMNPAERDVLQTVRVQWDEPAFGVDEVPAAGLEVIDGS